MFQVFYSPLLNTLLCVCIVIMVLINNRSIFKNNNKGGTGYFAFWMFITLFAMYYCPEDGDSYNGARDLALYASTGVTGHYENLYYLPLKFIHNSYYAWRFCVWGLAAYLTVSCFRVLKCSSQYSAVIFMTITLVPCFYYMRNCLGFSALYLAMILLLRHNADTKSRNRSIFMAVVLLIFSYFAHNSMPLYYLITIAALLCPFKYSTILILILIYPVIHRIVPDLASLFLTQSYVSEATAELGLDYLSDSNSANYNLNGLIMIVIQFLPFLIVYINAIKHMKDTEANYKIKRLFFQISFLLLYLAFCFWQTASNHLFLRFINTCTLPMALALAFYMTDKRSTKLNKVFMGALAMYYLLFTITSVI